MQSTQTKQERLNDMYKLYNLVEEDYFTSTQGWTIFRRSGVEKIEAAVKIAIKYTPVIVERDFVVIKASATMRNQNIETFGEADIKSNCKNKYPIAMAEKRAMSRAVLKLTGFYAQGHFGEDESDWQEKQ